jgi:hypothetical protein
MKANQSIQRTGASRFCQAQFLAQRGLAPAADAGALMAFSLKRVFAILQLMFGLLLGGWGTWSFVGTVSHYSTPRLDHQNWVCPPTLSEMLGIDWDFFGRRTSDCVTFWFGAAFIWDSVIVLRGRS